MEKQLSLFEEPEKVMTLEEVSKVLGYDSEYLRKKSAELGYTQNGKKTLLTEQQVTILKSKLIPRTSDMKIRAENAVTELEIISNAVNAFQNLQDLLNRKEKEYQAIIENQKMQIEEQKPKVEAYDNFISRDNFCNFRDGANYLHIKQSDLMNLLKSKYIYKNSIGEYRAYGEYSKYFVLRPFDKGYDRTGQQLMLSLEGLEFFKNKLSA